jgi:hypothetical protein
MGAATLPLNLRLPFCPGLASANVENIDVERMLAKASEDTKIEIRASRAALLEILKFKFLRGYVRFVNKRIPFFYRSNTHL